MELQHVEVLAVEALLNLKCICVAPESDGARFEKSDIMNSEGRVELTFIY